MHIIRYQDFQIRDWRASDRQSVADVIGQVLQEYGLCWEPDGADKDVLAVEENYLATGGEFWVIEQGARLVGTSAYYPINRGEQAVEIRKMYLLPEARGQGLGKFLLKELERKISDRAYQQIWIETASILKEAVAMYESQGYQAASGVETSRCDRVYFKNLSATTKQVR